MKPSFLAVIVLLTVTAAQAQTPYYQGKTIRIVTGYPAGDVNDLWPRLIARHMGKYIPGNPSFIVQNMPGASSMIAANYVYGVAKPDGLTLGWIGPTLYFDQMVGRKEARYDWAKYSFIGSPLTKRTPPLHAQPTVLTKPSKTCARPASRPNAAPAAPPAPAIYFPKLLEETVGAKFNIVLGYQGGGPIDSAVEKGEIHCRAMTIESFMAREPFHTWRKNNFVRSLAQSGRKRDARLPDTPTIYELMDQYKASEQSRRVATVILAGGVFGRPLVGPAGISPDAAKNPARRHGQRPQRPRAQSRSGKTQLRARPRWRRRNATPC